MMRKHFLYSVFLIVTGYFAFAQQPTHTTSPNYKGDSEYDLKNYKADPRDRLIFEVNYTNWLGAPKDIKSDWKCIGFAFATMFDKPFGGSNFSFAFGAGLYVHNYSSNANFIYKLDSTNSEVKTILEPKNIPYIANRYNERSVEVPLEFRFRTKSATMFKLMLGGKIGYVISDFRKTDDADGRVRHYNTKNINRLRYGLVFRVGVERICFTASYYLSEVFTKNGPQHVIPYSLGLAIIPY